MRRFSSAALIASLSIISMPVAALADGGIPVTLQSGHSVVISEPGLTRVAVGDGTIAGVLPVGTQQVVINGKAPGRTTVFVWDHHGRTSYEVRVTQQQVDDMAGLLRQSITQPGVAVTGMGKMIAVSGSVENTEQFQKIQAVINRFTDAMKIGGFQIINAVSVVHPLGNLRQEINRIPGGNNVRVDPDDKGNVVVSGYVEDRVTAERILGHVRGLAGPYLAIDGKVIDRIETATTAQIDVKVSVLEVDHSGQRQLGLNLQSETINPDGSLTVTGPQFPLIEGFGANTQGKGLAVNSAGVFRNVLLAPTVDALIVAGHARVLSSPDLVTLPGTKANFLVGGQIPYVFSTGLGQVSVNFKDYGVKLEVTPTILPNGSIEADIAPEISDLDFQDAVQQNGYSIPALKTSKLSTTAVTRPGESIVMGGMLRRVEQRNITKFPILGDLPILGKLFSSTNYQQQKTDVVFVFTPYIINR